MQLSALEFLRILHVTFEKTFTKVQSINSDNQRVVLFVVSMVSSCKTEGFHISFIVVESSSSSYHNRFLVL